jgi:peptidylprolyl isomerase
MRQLLPFLSACVLLLVVSACGEEEQQQRDPSMGDPANVQFAPSLGVDLAAMNRSESGLYTQDLVVGTGAEATLDRGIIVHYSGWMPDGTLFSTTRGEERGVRFTLDKYLIKGWQEGIVGMKEGGTRRLVIPSSLAYGEKGQGSIPPHMVLIFEVELLSLR